MSFLFFRRDGLRDAKMHVYRLEERKIREEGVFVREKGTEVHSSLKESQP